MPLSGINHCVLHQDHWHTVQSLWVLLCPHFLRPKQFLQPYAFPREDSPGSPGNLFPSVPPERIQHQSSGGFINKHENPDKCLIKMTYLNISNGRFQFKQTGLQEFTFSCKKEILTPFLMPTFLPSPGVPLHPHFSITDSHQVISDQQQKPDTSFGSHPAAD